jgi:hypothetical protein
MTLSVTSLYIECYYAECHLGWMSFMLSVSIMPCMLGVNIANVIMLNVIMLNVLAEVILHECN